MAYGVKLAVLISAGGIVLSAIAQTLSAAETEWLDINADQIATYEFEGHTIIINNILLREVDSRHSDELNVLEFKLHAKNKIEDEVYFDVMLIAYDSDDSIVFVSTARPSFYGITSYAKGLIETSQYVVPGSLDKIDRFQLKVIGVRKE